VKPSDVLDHATSEFAIGSKLGIDATKKFTGEALTTLGHRTSTGMWRRG